MITQGGEVPTSVLLYSLTPIKSGSGVEGLSGWAAGGARLGRGMGGKGRRGRGWEEGKEEDGRSKERGNLGIKRGEWRGKGRARAWAGGWGRRRVMKEGDGRERTG